MFNQLKYFLWTVPFICFLSSYFLFHFFFATPLLTVPSLIGTPLQEAIQILSQNNLNARILSQKEDNDLAEGTILNQIPAANRTIRSHQSIFLVLSKKAEQKKAPLFLQKSYDEIAKIANNQRIALKIYYLQHVHPENICIGQLPSPDCPLIDNKMTLYLSQGTLHKPVILPSLKTKPLHDVAIFLKEKNINFHVIHAKAVEADHVCKQCRVIDHKPLAGSLIDLRKPVSMQLYVQ